MKIQSAKILFFGVLILTTLFCEGCAADLPGDRLGELTPSISVQGKGSIEAVPDEATVSFGVASEARLLTAAYRDNMAKMNAIIATIKGVGIESRDIKTSSYSISPVYPTDDRGRRIPGQPVSYQVSQQLSVKVRDLSKAGGLIDQVVAEGTNMFHGIQFGLSNFQELEKQAKVNAAKDARERANLIAEGLNVKIGTVLGVGESSVHPYPVRKMMAFEAASVGGAPQIEAGSMEVSSTCSVSFEILQ